MRRAGVSAILRRVWRASLDAGFGECLPAELHAQREQPKRQGKAHGAGWDARGEAGTYDSSRDSANDQVREQRGIDAAVAEMDASTDEREAEAEG